MPSPSQLILLGSLGTARLRDEVITSLAPAHWYRADTNTLSGGNLASLPNRGTAGGQLGVAVGTMAAPGPDAALGTAPSLAFDGTQALASSLAASAFSFLHSGAGSEVFVVCKCSAAQVNRGLLSTSPGALLSQVGAQIYLNSETSLSLYLGNGTNYAVSPLPTATLPAAGTGMVVDLSSLSNSAPDNFVIGSSVGIGSFNLTPSTAAPASTLYVGSNGGGSGRFIGTIADILIFDRRLSVFERQLVREYVASRYGIAAPVVSADERPVLQLNPFSWLRADAYSGSSKVAALNDKVRPGHAFSQGTVANQAALPAVDAAFNNQLVTPFAGSAFYQTSLAAALWAFTNGNAFTGVLVFAPTSVAAGVRALYGTVYSSGAGMQHYQNGADLYSNATGDSSVIVIPNGVLGSVTLNAPTYSVLRAGSAASPQYVHGLKAAATRSGSFSNAPSANTPAYAMQLGALLGNSPGSFKFADWLAFDRVLTAPDLASVQSYIANRYAIAA